MANQRTKEVTVSGRTPKYTEITAARNRAGHTQQDMADVIDIPIGTLQNYEQDRRGKMEPSTFKVLPAEDGTVPRRRGQDRRVRSRIAD